MNLMDLLSTPDFLPVTLSSISIQNKCGMVTVIP